jgi:hypothetical protein
MRLRFAFLLLSTMGCGPGGAPTNDMSGGSGGSGQTTGGAGGSTAATGGSAGNAGVGGSTTGGTGGSTTGGTGGSAAGGTGGVPEPPQMGIGVGVLQQCTDPNAVSVGPTPVRRLSRLEYANAVRDLFGIMVNQGDLPSDELLGTFSANVRTRMTVDNFTRYDTAGRSVAEQVAANFPTVSGCGATETACIEAYLAAIARRAFHGQALGEADQTRLNTLYESIAGTDPTLAAQIAIRWILNSPRFLYAMDFGTPEGAVARLTPSEVAGRLASFLWRSVPDDALLAAADGGALATADGIRQEATRMLADAKAAPVLKQFATEWLGLNPSPPGGATLDAAIDAEPGEVLTAAAQGTGTYTDLISGVTSRGPAELAQFYGGTAAGDGSFTVPTERRGLLLRASFGRSHINGARPSPTQRGKQVREALLCEPVALPIDNVNMQLPPDTGQPNNELFDQHASDPECSGCHSQMDPIGYGFGPLTATGTWDPASAPNTAGYIGTANGNIDFADTAGLVDWLAGDTWPRQCFAIQTARFAFGRGETAADACSLVAVWEAFSAGNLSLQTLLVEIAASSGMQLRNVVNAGASCQ